MWSGRDRRRLLLSTLPLLATSNRVLLPGASVVVQVTDPRGFVVLCAAVWVVCVVIWKHTHTEDQLGGEQAAEWRRLEGQIHWNCASTVTLSQGEVDCHVVIVYAFILLLLSISSVALCSVSRIMAHSHPQPHFSLLATGLCRFRVESVEQEVPYLVGMVTQLDYMPSHVRSMDSCTLLAHSSEQYNFYVSRNKMFIWVQNITFSSFSITSTTFSFFSFSSSSPDDPLPRALDTLSDSFRSSAQELLSLLQEHSHRSHFSAVVSQLLQQAPLLLMS